MTSLPPPKKNLLRKLGRVFDGHKRLAIFMHNHPDPDSLASALILQTIARHFKVTADIILNGTPNQQENHTMIHLLNIPLHPAKHYDNLRHTLTALVDCQKSMKNHSFPEPHDPDITFDHHSEQHTPSSHNLAFKLVDPNVGATASLLMDILLALNLSVTPKLATAYAYALLSETRYLSREFSNYDVRIYKKIISAVNFITIANIQNTKRPRLFYRIFQKALGVYKVKKSIMTCKLGDLSHLKPSTPVFQSLKTTVKDDKITPPPQTGRVESSSNLDFVHQVAEELSRMEGVYLVIVTGFTRSQGDLLGKVSLRGEHPSLELGTWLKDAMMPHGSGGGHRTIAAGNFTCRESTVIKAVTQSIEKQTSLALRKQILRDLAEPSYRHYPPLL